MNDAALVGILIGVIIVVALAVTYILDGFNAVKDWFRARR